MPGGVIPKVIGFNAMGLNVMGFNAIGLNAMELTSRFAILLPDPTFPV